MNTKEDLFTFEFNQVKLTVKKEFKNLCNPSSVTSDDLCFNLMVENYLHNPFEAAVQNLKTNETLYYLNGKEFSEADWEQERHRIFFNSKMDNIINE